jgi:hypothetical protein
MIDRDERVRRLRALEEARGTVVIAYLTTTRPNLEVPMAMDAVPLVHEHLRAIQTPPEQTRIDLFIHSNGGDGVVPWRLVTLIREFCSQFSVLVPHRAFSAATLATLGADQVVMHRMGMLGPIDPTVTNPFNPQHPQHPGQLLGISVEDVSSYISLIREDVGIRHEEEVVQAFALLAKKVHPLALGNVKRATAQSRMLAEKLLRQRPGEELDDHEVAEIVEKLTSRLYFHGHPINRDEARHDLRLNTVEAAEPDLERVMWDLYEAYAEDMDMEREFRPSDPAFAADPIEPPAIPTEGGVPPPPVVRNLVLEPLRTAYVESSVRTDVHQDQFEVTIRRDWTGEVNTNVFLRSCGWSRVR